MRVLFWMFIGFDQHTTSEHLLSAVIERLCEAGHSVHVIQKNTGGSLPAIPKKLRECGVTTDAIPFQSADKGNFVARYLAELKYISACKKYFTSNYDAVFIQSTTVAGFAVKAVRKKLPNAIVTFNVQDIFPYNLMYTGKMKRILHGSIDASCNHVTVLYLEYLLVCKDMGTSILIISSQYQKI